MASLEVGLLNWRSTNECRSQRKKRNKRSEKNKVKTMDSASTYRWAKLNHSLHRLKVSLEVPREEDEQKNCRTESCLFDCLCGFWPCESHSHFHWRRARRRDGHFVCISIQFVSLGALFCLFTWFMFVSIGQKRETSNYQTKPFDILWAAIVAKLLN